MPMGWSCSFHKEDVQLSEVNLKKDVHSSSVKTGKGPLHLVWLLQNLIGPILKSCSSTVEYSVPISGI